MFWFLCWMQMNYENTEFKLASGITCGWTHTARERNPQKSRFSVWCGIFCSYLIQFTFLKNVIQLERLRYMYMGGLFKNNRPLMCFESFLVCTFWGSGVRGRSCLYTFTLGSPILSTQLTWSSSPSTCETTETVVLKNNVWFSSMSVYFVFK